MIFEIIIYLLVVLYIVMDVNKKHTMATSKAMGIIILVLYCSVLFIHVSCLLSSSSRRILENTCIIGTDLFKWNPFEEQHHHSLHCLCYLLEFIYIRYPTLLVSLLPTVIYIIMRLKKQKIPKELMIVSLVFALLPPLVFIVMFIVMYVQNLLIKPKRFRSKNRSKKEIERANRHIERKREKKKKRAQKRLLLQEKNNK